MSLVSSFLGTRCTLKMNRVFCTDRLFLVSFCFIFAVSCGRPRLSWMSTSISAHAKRFVSHRMKVSYVRVSVIFIARQKN